MTPLDRLQLAGEMLADFIAWLIAVNKRWPLIVSLVEVLLFCLLSYALFDRLLATTFKAHLGPQTEGFFKVMTSLGLSEPWLIGSALAWGYCRLRVYRAAYLDIEVRFRRLSNSALFLFLSISVSGLFGDALKFLIGRTRPRLLFDQGIYGFEPFSAQWALNSMPSGHSQTAFAAFVALIYIVPRYDLLWVLLAVLVAASRVVTSVHFLSDAVIGSYIGIIGAILLHRLFVARGAEVRLRFERDRTLND